MGTTGDRRPESPGARLRRHRVRAGLSQDALAAAAGLSSRALRDIERDRVRRPRAESLRRLATVLRVPAAELFEPGGAARTGAQARVVRIDVLGPLAVRHGDEGRQLTATLPRRVLAVLALHHPGAVTIDDLVDSVWEEPPRSARSLIHVYVRQIRQVLEPDRARGQQSTTVLHEGDVLRLTVPPERLDLARFDAAAQRGSELAATDPAAAFAVLQEALALWRDVAVLGGVDQLISAHPAAVAAVGRRVRAVQAAADLAHRLGRPADVLPLVADAVAAEPLHEGLHTRLITALGAAGEQAKALEVFGAFRRRLAEELGIEPGAEVQDAYLGVLRRNAAPVRALVPAQLPAEAGGYAGRRRQLGQLDAMLRGFEEGRAAGVLAIVGAPGVGKTALAVRWAHRVRDRFPDGQLYADLRANSSIPPMRPLEVVSQFLRALGVPAERVPSGLDEAAAMFRTAVAERRLLVVLDDAAGVEQVRPVLPGGAGCAVLVTSRSQLSGLVAREGTQRLTLDVLSPDEATGLLTGLLGGAGVAVEPDAVAELARICGWLPLAIRIAAANLLSREHGTIAGYAAELRAGDVLNGLQVDGDDQSAVRAAFALSFRRQPAATRRLFRLLSLMPSADLPAGAAAALAGGPAHETTDELRRLTGMHLVEQRAGGRYRLHDLLRRYAGELAAREGGAEERDAARDRLARWFGDRVDAAGAVLYPDRLRVPAAGASADVAGPPVEPAPGAARAGTVAGPGGDTGEATGRAGSATGATGRPTAATFADHEAALDWLAAERTNLVELVTQHAKGPRAHAALAWRLADALHGWFALTMHTMDWERVARAGHAAAVVDGSLPGQASALLSLGACQWVQGQNAAAVRAFEQAAEVSRRCGWLDGEAEALSSLGSAHDEEGRPHEAAGLLARARTLTRRSGRRQGEAATVFRIGLLKWKAGDLSRAADRYREAAALYDDLGSPSAAAISRTNLGMIYRAMGRPDDTDALVSAALDVHRTTGNQVSEAIALCSLSGARCDRGRYPEALDLARAALAAAVGIGHIRLQANASNAIADVLSRTGRVDEAVEHYERAVRLATEANDRHPEVHALVGLAAAELRTGDAARARRSAETAMRWCRSSNFRVYEGRALTVLGTILLADGDVAGALEAAQAALPVHEWCGHRPGEARTHLLLGRVHGRLGDPARAFGHLRRARDLFAAMGSPEFAEARTASAHVPRTSSTLEDA